MRDSTDRRLAALAEAQFGIVTVADARRVGLSDAQIAHRSGAVWTPVHEGVYRLPGAPATWKGELFAAASAATKDAAISHRAAAGLYELPGGRRDLVELMCHRWNRSQRPGIVVHESRRLHPADVTTVDGIPVVTPELLLLQLAWWKPAPKYVEAVIHAARRRRLISHASAHATFLRHARRGLRGVAVLRQELERWNPHTRPTESEMETLLLQTMRARGIPELVLQFEVYDERGLFVARTDAALPQWRITVDYESMQEHLDEFQRARDDRRRNQIMAAGYFPLSARIADLRSGGWDLADEIRAVARHSA
jgi:predicted transcriptional regulator of viral defense system